MGGGTGRVGVVPVLEADGMRERAGTAIGLGVWGVRGDVGSIVEVLGGLRLVWMDEKYEN